MTELLSPVQKIDESIIDVLDAFELKGERLTGSTSEAGSYRKLHSLSKVQSHNVDEGVIRIQSAASRDLKKDMPGNRDLADEPTESGFSGYLYVDIQNFQGGDGTILIAGSDVDIHVRSSGGSGIFNIEIWEWNYNGPWHPDIEEFSQVAVVATSVSLGDVIDLINTKDPYSDYLLDEQDGIIMATLPQDLPFRYMNNLLSFLLYQYAYS